MGRLGTPQEPRPEGDAPERPTPDAERREAEVELALVDADVARWYVYDGQLSEAPLAGTLSDVGRELRKRRLAAVEALERAGGRDPAPMLLRPPTEAQRAHYDRWGRLANERLRLAQAADRVAAVFVVTADRAKLEAYHGGIADEIRAEGREMQDDDTPERFWLDRARDLASDELQVAYYGWSGDLDMSFRLLVEGDLVEIEDGEL